MGKLSLYKHTIVLFICFLLPFMYSQNVTQPINSVPFLVPNLESNLTSEQDPPKAEKDQIVVSFAVCGSRINESLNVVKSVLLFSLKPVNFVIFCTDILRPKLEETLSRWQVLTLNRFNYELHKINLPNGIETTYWLYLYDLCSTQRLFLPSVLTHIDSAIYVDIDTVFLGPVEKLWRFLTKFNSSQIMALAWESERLDYTDSWYPSRARHPFYGKLGLAAGVMLMNLTRMRSFGWTESVLSVVETWKEKIILGDQDIINILFYFHPEAVFRLKCRYNYRPDSCIYENRCVSAEKRGVVVLHAYQNILTKKAQHVFKSIIHAIEEYEVGTDPSKTLLVNMERYFSETPLSEPCVYLKHEFFKLPIKTFNRLYGKPVKKHNYLLTNRTSNSNNNEAQQYMGSLEEVGV